MHERAGREPGEGRPQPDSPAPDSPAADPRSPLLRLAAVLDPGPEPLDAALLRAADGSGFLAARGTIHGTPVIAFVSDATVMGGAMGVAGCEVLVAAYEAALADGVPVVGVWHSGGARLAEGVASLHAVGRVFTAMTRASGRIPQLSLVLGPAAGGAAYGPALTDVVVLGPEGRIFVTGPEVVRSVTGEAVDMRRLGGPEPLGRRTGLVHVIAADDAAAYADVRHLASLLGAPGAVAPTAVVDADLAAGLPSSARRAYDARVVVERLLDDGTGVELHAGWGPNIVTALGRLGGGTVGVLANNPLRLGGCLDATAAEKAARFVRTCDAFGIPLVVLVDVPGYLPGVGQEWDGVVRRGAKLLHAFAEASVPRVTVVTRKAYGGAYIAMNSRSLGATRVLAWPGAEIAVMGAVAAVRILHRRRLAEAAPEDRDALETALAAEHETTAGGLDRAVELGVVDEIVAPGATRSAVAAAIAAAPPARGSHGNIPL